MLTFLLSKTTKSLSNRLKLLRNRTIKTFHEGRLVALSHGEKVKCANLKRSLASQCFSF